MTRQLITTRRHRLCVLALLCLAGCTGVPEGVEPVRDLELSRYLGTWYEIARLDHGFERGLSRVTATYSRHEDGGVKVVNRGYDAESERWKEAVGRAYFIGEPNVGRLKVSFFGPFYGAYNVIALDADYRWSLVVGPSRDYLWILARSPELPDDTVAELVERARELDFPTEELIFVSHEP